MIIAPHQQDIRQVVIMNPKGGCGKTTLATNLASQFASRGYPAALIDNDPIGYASRWLERRPENASRIHGLNADFLSSGRRWFRRSKLPGGIRLVLVDTPAALDRKQVEELTRNADCILVPVLPSAFDIQSATRFVAELLLITQLVKPIGVVANRTRAHTQSLRTLLRTLATFETPTVAMLRDSQNYVGAAEAGLGVCELPRHLAKNDAIQMNNLANWLDRLLFSSSTSPIGPDADLGPVSTPPRTRDQLAAN